MDGTLELGRFELEYRHVGKFRLLSFDDIFAETSYHALLQAFNKVSWFEKKTSFYSQYKSFVLPSDSHALATLYNPSFFIPFKNKLEAALGIRFQDRIKLIAHKLVTSHEIGVHNDYSDPELGHENFRFIFQFAVPQHTIRGGELIFLASRYDTEDRIQCYPPKSNQGICFEITPHSYHMVSAVEGERYTLVAYLWEEGRKCVEPL